MKATRTGKLFATARKSLAAVPVGSHNALGFTRGTFMFWAAHARNPHSGRKVHGQQGFTLLELLVVLGILALLATFAAPQVLRYLGRAKSETAKLQINAISSATELYALDNGGYPPQEAGLGVLMRAPQGAMRWSGPYLMKAEGLIDPWGRPYQYRNPERNGTFEVFTLGRDNAPGGAGEDQDINN